MIEKIRRALIVKYTAVIACILFLGFAASYAAYRHNGIKLLQDSLYDYLAEEIWEAQEYFRHGGESPETHTINSDIRSLHNLPTGCWTAKSSAPNNRETMLSPASWNKGC